MCYCRNSLILITIGNMTAFCSTCIADVACQQRSSNTFNSRVYMLCHKVKKVNLEIYIADRKATACI